MEAQKPNANPAPAASTTSAKTAGSPKKPDAAAQSKKSNAPGIKNAFWVILICAALCVLLFIFWFGNDMHFDEDGHPQNIWGTI